MEHTAKGLRKKLLSLVKRPEETPEKYASGPGRDFTRRRALGFENIILLLLTMSSESVGKNLMEVFRFQEKAPSAPAFVQQRKNRIVRIETGDGKTETLITNLNPQKFPPYALKALYAKRWGIETSFRSLKYTLIHLHSKIPMLILREIFAAFLIFNFTKAVSWGVETPQDPQKRKQHLNFSDAVFACCRFLHRSVMSLEALLRRKRFPLRLGRTFPKHPSSGNPISCCYLSSR